MKMRIRRSYDMEEIDALRETQRVRLVEEAAVAMRYKRAAAEYGHRAPRSARRAAWAVVLALLT